MREASGIAPARPASEPRGDARSRAKLIAIASGKGGVGKTWLAITLSQALAQAGQRTLLFDGDLGLANVDIQLGLAPSQDLGGVMSGQYGLGRATERYEAGQFDIVAGRSGSGSLASLAPAKVAALCDDLMTLTADYDRVVLDLGAGIDRTVRQLADCAARVLVVCTDEPTSLTDAYAFIKLMVQQRSQSDLQVVVNMAESPAQGQATYSTLSKACSSFLKVRPPLAAVVRRDPKVKESIRNQTPLLTRYPTSPAAEDVARLVRTLLAAP